MNATAKDLRGHARAKSIGKPWASYYRDRNGTIRLMESCGKAIYRRMKDRYKKGL